MPHLPSSNLAISTAFVPLVAEAWTDHWMDYAPMLFVAIAICIVAAAFMVVSYLRRRRENSPEDSDSQTNNESSATFATTRAHQRIQRERDGQNTLGWEIDAANPLASSSSDIAPGSVLGQEKTILIADDDPVVVAALSQRLRHLGFQVLRSSDASHALMGAMKTLPDLVILDLQMPSGNGLAVCEMLACDQRCTNIPVIIHSVFTDQAVKDRCRQLGAHYVEKSTHSWAEIKQLVESLLCKDASSPSPKGDDENPLTHPAREHTSAAIPQKSSQAESPRALCIESPKDCLEPIERRLSENGVAVFRTSDLEEGFWTCFTENPQVVIVQMANNEKKLLSLLKRLKEHPVTRKIPVLLVNEGNTDVSQWPLAANVKVLEHPLHWEKLLSVLEDLCSHANWSRNESPASDAIESETHPEDEAATDTEGLHMIAAKEHKSLKVLCIDDDPVVLRTIAIRFQPYGIKVKGADNGTEGYLLATTELPDLIVLDLKMPNGEGNYILGKLKDNPHTKKIPVIVLTQNGTAGLRRQMIGLGAEAFLNKPIQWNELFMEMGRCVHLPQQLLLDYNLPEQLTLGQL
jgi:CheY-like chemotaxis protein